MILFFYVQCIEGGYSQIHVLVGFPLVHEKFTLPIEQSVGNGLSQVLGYIIGL